MALLLALYPHVLLLLLLGLGQILLLLRSCCHLLQLKLLLHLLVVEPRLDVGLVELVDDLLLELNLLRLNVLQV